MERLLRLLAVCGFLLLAVIAVFGQTASHDFVNFDDDDYVYENRHVKGGLTGEGIAWAITTYYASQLAPADLALAHARLPALWPEARRPSSDQRALARRRGDPPVPGLAADDRGHSGPARGWRRFSRFIP